MFPNFVNIRHFSATDKTHAWGDASKIDHRLLVKVDLLVDLLNTKVIVTSGFRPKDVGSQHALGLALDLMFPEFKGSLKDIYAQAEKLGFKGLGVYPDWKYAGKRIGGIHVDERNATKPARWMGVLENDKQIYIGLNQLNLTKYKVV